MHIKFSVIFIVAVYRDIAQTTKGIMINGSSPAASHFAEYEASHDG